MVLYNYLPGSCPLRFMSVGVCTGRTKIGISQPCAVRLSWNLVETWGWYLRLTCMFWFQDLIIFYIVNKQKNAKTAKNGENRGFTKLAFSPLFQVRLIWNLVGTSGQLLGIVWYVCFVYIIVCLHFVNVNKENTLYGSFGRLQVKSLKLGGCLHLSLIHNPVYFFVDLMVCLCFMDINKWRDLVPFWKNAKRSSIWVSNERSRYRE
jgi:hypothetical protein